MLGTIYASSFFFQAEDGIRGWSVTGVQTCALPISVEEGAPLHGDTQLGDVGDPRRVVRLLVDRYRQVLTDFPRRDVEGRHELDRIGGIPADPPVGQTRLAFSLFVVVDTLDYRGGAVPDTRDRDSDSCQS